jgi:hypothetical protein
MFLAEGRPASAKEDTMTRPGNLISCVAFAFGAALLGCGSSTPSGGGGSGGGGSGGSGGSGGGGGGGASGALDVVPASGAIPGWTIDPSNSDTAGKVAATATTEPKTEALIDGAAADFFQAPNTPTLFAWQEYVSTTVTGAPDGARVKFYVLEMPSADQAASLYSSLRSASLYSRKTGTPEDWAQPSSPLVGTDSRIQDTGDHWWINFYKGKFYVEVSMSPSAGPAPEFLPGNADTKAAAFAFATAVAGKI